MDVSTLPSSTPGTQPAMESLDTEILSKRNEIATLTSQRQILTSHLLASQSSTLAALSTPEIIATNDRLESLQSQASRASVISVHRTLIPTTTFAAKDPAPDAPDDGHVLGIRFEDYSVRTRKFRTPFYLLLHRPWLDTKDRVRKEVKVHRHTFPDWVGVESLERIYLPRPEHGNEDEDQEDELDIEQGQQGGQDLPGLVTELRNRVANCQRREEAVEGLGDEQGVRKIEWGDAERLAATLYMQDGGTISLSIDHDGNIQHVRGTDANGNRRFDLERQWKGKKHINLISS